MMFNKDKIRSGLDLACYMKKARQVGWLVSTGYIIYTTLYNCNQISCSRVPARRVSF